MSKVRTNVQVFTGDLQRRDRELYIVLIKLMCLVYQYNESCAVMKKMLSSILCISILLSLAPPVSAAMNKNRAYSVDVTLNEFEQNFPESFSYNTDYFGDDGEYVYIEYDVLGDQTFVELFVDNELSQRAYSCPSENLVLWVDYKNVSRSAQANLCSAQYSELVSTVEYVDTVTQEDVTNSRAAIPFDPSEWGFIKTVPSNPFITGSKPCSMYGRNYDEDPDLNRYNGKKITADAGTLVSVIVSLVAVFIAGEVTVKAIIIALGSGIASDVITKAISGDVCFSTQKISYAAVIDGMNMFNNAYITKRWIIISDTVNKKETYELDNPEYDYNRGHSVEAIAYNAQLAEVDSR